MSPVDGAGAVRAESDDIAPDDLNARIRRSLAPGAYGLRVRGFGTTTGPYGVGVRRELPGGGAGMTGTPVAVNGPAVSGGIGVAGERGLYRFTAPSLGASATLVAENDDAGGGLLTSRIERGLASGTYHVQVSGFGGATGPYTLTVRR